MSFTFDVKEELAHVMPARDCCRRAELAALWRFGRRHEAWVVDSAATARKVVQLTKRTWGRAASVRSMRVGSRYRFVLSSADQESEWNPENPCCRRSFLRGLFLAAGWLASPERGHHLELVLPCRGDAEAVRDILAREEFGARVGRRQGSYLVYLKDGEQVARFLSLIKASGAFMRFENVRAFKEVKNLVNRLVNADTANVEKSVDAAARQVEDIRAIVAAGVWERLPRALQEVALVRLRYPDASLRELGEALVPPVGKSGINHRLRRLHAWAEQARRN